MDIRKLQRVIVDGLEDVKAQNIVVFNTEHLSALFERVIIASGTSNRQTKSLAGSVRDAVKKAGHPVPRLEGEGNGEWIIVDCGAAVVHVMQPTIREYYHLEEIWGDKPVNMKLASNAVGLVKAAEPAAPAKKVAARKAVAQKVVAKKVAARRGGSDRVPAKAPARTKRAAAPVASRSPARSPASSPASSPARSPARAPAKTLVAGQTAPARKLVAKKSVAAPSRVVTRVVGVKGAAAVKKAPARGPVAKKTAFKAAPNRRPAVKAPARSAAATPAKRAPATSATRAPATPSKRAPARKAPAAKRTTRG